MKKNYIAFNIIIFFIMALVISCSESANLSSDNSSSSTTPYSDDAFVQLASGWSVETLLSSDIVMPDSLTFDSSNNLYVLDRARRRIMKENSSGELSEYVNLTAINASKSIAYQPGGDRLIIATSEDELYSYDGNTLNRLKSSGVHGSSIVVDPSDDSFYFCSQTLGESIDHYDKDGNFIETIVSNVRGGYHLALDTTNNLLYYSETYTGKVYSHNLSTNVTTELGSGFGIPNSYEPIAVGLDTANSLYVFDTSGLKKYQNNSFSLVKESISGGGRIIFDKNEQAFICANGAGGNLINYPVDGSNATMRTPLFSSYSIAQMSDGTVLIAEDENYGKSILRISEGKTVDFTDDFNAPVNTIERDENGIVYAAGFEQIYTVSSNGTLTEFGPAFEGEMITHLSYDSLNNYLYVMTGNESEKRASLKRLFIESPHNITTVKLFSSAHVNNINPSCTTDLSGNVYVFERQSNIIYKYDSNGNESIVASDVLSNSAITVPSIEYSSVIDSIIVTGIDDLTVITREGTTSVLGKNNGSVDNFSISENPDGSLIGIHSGRIYKLTKK